MFRRSSDADPFNAGEPTLPWQDPDAVSCDDEDEPRESYEVARAQIGDRHFSETVRARRVTYGRRGLIRHRGIRPFIEVRRNLWTRGAQKKQKPLGATSQAAFRKALACAARSAASKPTR